MKKLAFIGGAAGLGLGALLLASPTHASDHLDAPAVLSNPMADITDVYAWMSPDTTKVNLVMNVSPADDGANAFGPSILYAFHVTSWSAYGGSPSPETDVICEFASNTSVQCWVGSNAAYVTGDPSGSSAPFLGDVTGTGKVTMFAGQRSDPFFFNFNGFKDAIGGAEALVGSGTVINAAGCPGLSDGDGQTLFNGPEAKLSEGPQNGLGHAPCNGTGTNGTGTTADCFQNLNVMSIVLQIDKTLLNVGANSVLSVWGSTNSPG